MADKLGIDLVWFGVLLAVNMQTSFMHPPFGFALFYLRSVAPANDYNDRISGKTLARVTTGQIYWGAVPFVLIQILMVGLIIAFPGIVSGGLGKAAAVDTSNVKFDFQPDNEKIEMDANKLFGPATAAERCAHERRSRCRRAGRSARAGRRRGEEEVGEERPRRLTPWRGRGSRSAGAAPATASELLRLHEVVEARLGEAEPEVFLAAERRVVLVDLLPRRILRRQVAVERHAPP